MNKIKIIELDELEQPADTPFWNVVESDELKSLLILQIMSELGEVDVALLTDEQCRTVLSRCQAHFHTFTFRKRYEGTKPTNTEVTDDYGQGRDD